MIRIRYLGQRRGRGDHLRLQLCIALSCKVDTMGNPEQVRLAVILF